MLQKEVSQVGIGKEAELICSSMPWNSSEELGWEQKKMGCWVKDQLVVLSGKTLKSMGVFFTESPYLSVIICVCFCVLLRFSTIKSLTNASFCLEL